VRVRAATLAALRFASLPRQLSFDPDARERWIAVYGPLSRGEEGLLGAATRRAEAHVVRLAAIYATLDTSEHIRLPHLEAALAVWRYSLDTARWIFGDTLGDPTADEIWALASRRDAQARPGGRAWRLPDLAANRSSSAARWAIRSSSVISRHAVVRREPSRRTCPEASSSRRARASPRSPRWRARRWHEHSTPCRVR
jgi:hypothetical protein